MSEIYNKHSYRDRAINDINRKKSVTTVMEAVPKVLKNTFDESREENLKNKVSRNLVFSRPRFCAT